MKFWTLFNCAKRIIKYLNLQSWFLMLLYGLFGGSEMTIFNCNFTHKIRILQQIEQIIQLRLTSSTKFSSVSAHRMFILQNWGCEPRIKIDRSVQFSWTALDEEWLKINIDCFSSHSRAGYAAIIRDFKSEIFSIVHSFSVNNPFI